MRRALIFAKMCRLRTTMISHVCTRRVSVTLICVCDHGRQMEEKWIVVCVGSVFIRMEYVKDWHVVCYL